LLFEQQEQSLLCDMMKRDAAEYRADVSVPNNWGRYQALLIHTSNTDNK